jgi:hypothetical protein
MEEGLADIPIPQSYEKVIVSSGYYWSCHFALIHVAMGDNSA